MDFFLFLGWKNVALELNNELLIKAQDLIPKKMDSVLQFSYHGQITEITPELIPNVTCIRIDGQVIHLRTGRSAVRIRASPTCVESLVLASDAYPHPKKYSPC